MVATFVIPKWMREKVINGVELAIVFKAHLIFFVSFILVYVFNVHNSVVLVSS